jgi:hypothetical protein
MADILFTIAAVAAGIAAFAACMAFAHGGLRWR